MWFCVSHWEHAVFSGKDKQHERCPEKSNNEFLWQPTDRLSRNIVAMNWVELDPVTDFSNFATIDRALFVL